MRTGITYTRHFDVETKQHELLGLELGEGWPRKAIVLGFVLYLVWTGGLLLIFGVPSKVAFSAYVLPPLLIAVIGTKRSTRNPRRWNITYWTLSLRYLIHGHRPVICGGRRSAHRSEWIDRRARWGTKGDGLRRKSTLARRQEELEHHVPPALSGTPLVLDARPRLHGPDAVYRAYGRKHTTHTKGQR
ncbi:hypothetical protein AB0G29_35155 [Streptomyces parvus]|uniref:hypothetical protein n=1 Tax=Streptomyces parvus TaxID=66428 RepID=UPI0034057388